MTNARLDKFIKNNGIENLDDLKALILSVKELLDVDLVYMAAEYLNPNREAMAAYYTDDKICEYIFPELPSFKNKNTVSVVEPSVGAGRFIPHIAEKYKDKDILEISIIDLDPDELEMAEVIFETFYRKKYPNVAIKYIHEDYLDLEFSGKKFDLIIGNPPYAKVKDKELLKKYKKNSLITKSQNLFIFFIEKAMHDADNVSLVIPKSLLNAPEYGELREMINKESILSIIDFGENGFKGVKIETINLLIAVGQKPRKTHVVSVSQRIDINQQQKYITSRDYPSWLLYRNQDFDEFAKTLELGMFEAFRDRQIVNSMLSASGKFRVLKSRNVASNEVVNIDGYDSYIDKIDALAVGKYVNRENVVMIPNLSYAPRGCLLPKETIVNGSVALLTASDGRLINEADLEIFGSKEFCEYYRIARNFGTRSLNIDNNSVYFFGLRRK